MSEDLGELAPHGSLHGAGGGKEGFITQLVHSAGTSEHCWSPALVLSAAKGRGRGMQSRVPALMERASLPLCVCTHLCEGGEENKQDKQVKRIVL